MRRARATRSATWQSRLWEWSRRGRARSSTGDGNVRPCVSVHSVTCDRLRTPRKRVATLLANTSDIDDELIAWDNAAKQDSPPSGPQRAGDVWEQVRELHERLVALESEMARSRERAQRPWHARLSRVPARAAALAGKGSRGLRNTASHLPHGLKPPLRAVRRLAHRSSPRAAPAPSLLVFSDSAVAHRFLDGLAGIEIGASSHNAFHIPGCLTVDYTDEPTVFTEEQVRLSGEVTHVDIVAPGDDLPFPDASLDYVLSSHVLEHFYDPIEALHEWSRVVRPGGYIFMIIPHRDRTFDRERTLTSIDELRRRHTTHGIAAGRRAAGDESHDHQSVWTTRSFLELCAYLDLRIVHVDDVDDKVGNGFTVVVQR